MPFSRYNVPRLPEISFLIVILVAINQQNGQLNIKRILFISAYYKGFKKGVRPPFNLF